MTQRNLFDEPPMRPPSAGRTEDTRATSEEAADTGDESLRARQRRAVLEAIIAEGPQGLTDDELQLHLDLDGNSERPRRWELWKAGRIQPKRDSAGQVVHRLTRTRRRAVVWVAA